MYCVKIKTVGPVDLRLRNHMGHKQPTLAQLVSGVKLQPPASSFKSTLYFHIRNPNVCLLQKYIIQVKF